MTIDHFAMSKPRIQKMGCVTYACWQWGMPEFGYGGSPGEAFDEWAELNRHAQHPWPSSPNPPTRRPSFIERIVRRWRKEPMKSHPLIPTEPPLFAIFEFDTLSGMAWIATTDEETARRLIRERVLERETGIMAIPLPSWAYRFMPADAATKRREQEHVHMVG